MNPALASSRSRTGRHTLLGADFNVGELLLLPTERLSVSPHTTARTMQARTHKHRCHTPLERTVSVPASALAISCSTVAVTVGQLLPSDAACCFRWPAKGDTSRSNTPCRQPPNTGG